MWLYLCQKCLTWCCVRAVDPPKTIQDAREYEKAEMEARYREQVAELAFGEDADALGGLTLDRNFARSSETSACGKAEVLVRLLAVWATENTRDLAGNKARALN